MSLDVDLPAIEPDDFVRRLSLRASKVMWFLGAGASASAGIPTAGDMIAEFKQHLYVTQRKASPASVADLSNPLVRSLLQNHIDSSGQFPAPGAADEYATLFEAVWPAERDRQTYLDAKISGGKPSYGHIALATLLKADKARVVWTTNFDPLVADACARVYGGTGRLTTATPDAPGLATEALQAERWPIEIKLHGDFRSRLLRNTTDELRHQDEKLRRALVECCARYGLVVAGYSGRDDSIMGALDEVLDGGSPFPAGLFWLHRGDGPPLPRVTDFLRRAKAKLGSEVGLVRTENFDETLRDLIRATSGIDTSVLDAFAASRRWRSAAPAPQGRKGWPVIRLNGLQLEAPSVCRRVVCDIGGTREVRDAVEKAGVDVLAARRQVGIIAFGSDADVRAAFAPHSIQEFDLHTIDPKRLRHDSAERGLLRDALTRALARQRGMRSVHARTKDHLIPIDTSSAQWVPLRKLLGTPLAGAVPNVSGLSWHEAVSVRLEWADGRPWLVFEPRVIFEGKTLENKSAASDFGREHTVRRYNRQLNELVGFWSSLLAGGGQPVTALGIADGVDASFRLTAETAYSRRAG